MGVKVVVCVDGVGVVVEVRRRGGGSGSGVDGGGGWWCDGDELAAVVTRLPALSSHVRHQYVE